MAVAATLYLRQTMADSVCGIRFRRTFTSTQLLTWLQSKFSESKEPQLKAKQVTKWKGNGGGGKMDSQ